MRLNWVRGFEISDNVLPYGNISWWGGGAMEDQGGGVGFLRRVLKGRIKGNYCSWNNGGVYGNNGSDILVGNNTLEYSIDTALDFEGCINCLGIGNTISHFGNFATSVFYASINNAFIGNTINVTKLGASISAMVGVTTYMASSTITNLTDNGDGTTTIQVSSSATPDIQTGQIVLVPSLTGGAKIPVEVTRVSSISYRVPLAYSPSWVTGGDFYYQTGNTYFQVISGFQPASDGTLQGQTSFTDNTVVARDGLIGRSADGPHDTVTVSNNRFTNCRVALRSTSGGTKIVESNVLQWKYKTLPARLSSDTGLFDVRGWAEHISISYNSIIAATPTQVVPAGSYAIYAASTRYSTQGMSAKIEGNVAYRYASATVAAGIYFSSQNTRNLGATARIAHNQVASIIDASPAGACKVAYSGNIDRDMLALDKLTVTPVSGATVQMTGAGHTVYLDHADTIAALTLALPIDPADDAAYRIVARAAVTALTIANATTGAPSVYGTAPTALAAGQTVRVSYSASQNAWIWG